MLAVAISLLFGLAALASVVVIHASAVHGAWRARQIMAELSAGESRGVRIIPARHRGEASPPLFAAA